jgi:tRNA(fMet)-specific endonuclease VapC
VNFLLDTNVCISLINNSSETARKRFERALATKHQIFLSSIAVFELWYGVFRSSRVRFNSDRLEAFLEAPVSILSFDDDDARAAGLINAKLKAGGNPIASYDLLMAGQAIEKNLILVTANISEFSRVRGLTCQDWARA